MMLYGLIGHPVSHSFSPDYFNEKFRRENIDGTYQAFDLPEIAELPNLLKQFPDLKGLNVTIPHKEKVLPFLDALSEDVRAIGAVNCIAIREEKLLGYNTDWIGFWESLEPLLLPFHKAALILGNGGASKAVQYAFSKNRIPYQIVSRKHGAGLHAYSEITKDVLVQHQLIINTTSLGMHPLTNAAPPFPYALLGKNHLLYDLIYRPAESLFLQNGKAAGATIKNGLEMLELQALESWRIWQEGEAKYKI